MTLSQPTYDALPYAYIMAGILTGIMVDSNLRFLPAFMLIAAGLLVIGWRQSARMRNERAVRQRMSRNSPQRS